MTMDEALVNAIEKIHPADGWVHLSTVGLDGGPHVTPMMMGVHDEGLLFSLTGRQKKLNMRRDPRACVSISKPGSLAHVIVWGAMDIRHDDEAQKIWEDLLRGAFGEEGLKDRARDLSFEATSLGVLSPTRYRIYGLE